MSENRVTDASCPLAHALTRSQAEAQSLAHGMEPVILTSSLRLWSTGLWRDGDLVTGPFFIPPASRA